MGAVDYQQKPICFSDEQRAIFDFVSETRKNLVVRARAGTGKTFTAVHLLSLVDASEKVLFCAFNKSIAEELKHKVSMSNPACSVDVKTLHSLGFAFLRCGWRAVKVDPARGRSIAEKVVGNAMPAMLKSEHKDLFASVCASVQRIASLSKCVCPFGKLPEFVDLALELDAHSEAMEENDIPLERLAGLAIESTLASRVNDGTCDFDDMVYLPVVLGMGRPWYSTILIDECQDLNKSQILLAQSAGNAGSRKIVIGDDKQAIYGFRGADSGSLDRLKCELNATELGLSVTYRCAERIVDVARKYVPEYSSAPGAPDGIVDCIGNDSMMEQVRPGDAILSRLNAPLVSTCLSLLVRNIRAKIQGRDIGSALVSLVDKISGKGRSISKFLAKLQEWEAKQKTKIIKAGRNNVEQKVLEISDKAECLRVIASDSDSVKELKDRIESLFSEEVDAKTVLLSSVHKAKGLEWDRVFVLEETFNESRGQEEKNIAYVAKTRARNHLTIVGKASNEG